MKKFTFLAVALLFLTVVSSASELDKRTNTCPQQYKRNVLGKRTNIKKCPCALASAAFEEKVTGLVIFAQDECGSTTITGFFSKGLDNPEQNNYTFAVVDDCGNITHDLGNLDATFVDGGTKPFAKKFDFNLNCDRDGILLQPSAKLYKRTNDCKKKYYKRDGSNMIVRNNEFFYSGANVSAFG